MSKNRPMSALSLEAVARPLLVNPSAMVNMSEDDNLFERSVHELQEAITRRAHELWQSSGYTSGHEVEDWIRAESEVLRFVPVEITESDNDLRVYAEVPGLSARDLDIQLEPKRLIIRGKTEQSRERTKGQVSYSEREGTQIFRALTLPREVDTENATAVLRDGVLELTLPKASNAKGTRIQVKAA